MKKRFVSTKGGPRKFWTIELSGKTVTENFGRIGTLGKLQTRKLASPKAAQAEALRLENEKRRHGYREPNARVKAAARSFAELYERATALCKAGDFAAAYPVLDTLLAAHGKSDGNLVAAAFNLRGVCKQKLNEKGSLADFQRASKLGDFDARTNLVEHYCFIAPDYARAISYRESALPDLNETAFCFLKGIGLASLMTGDAERAKNGFQFLLESREYKSPKHKARIRADLDAALAQHPGRKADFEPIFRLLRGEKEKAPPKVAAPPAGKTTARDWVLWTYDDGAMRNAGRVRHVQNVERDYELEQGVSRAKSFPANARAEMLKAGKRGLTDNFNAGHLILASPRLVAFLKQHAVKNVEYLPLRLFEANGKLASKDYCLVNPIGLQGCLDVKASKPSYNSIIRTHVDTVRRLVINPKRIEPGVQLFRMKGLMDPILVHRALADALAQEQFTGLRFAELRDFNAD